MDKTNEANVSAKADSQFNDDLTHISSCHGIWNDDFVCMVAEENVFLFLNCFRSRPFTDFIADKDLDTFKNWWAAIAPGQTSTITLTLRRADGEERLVYLIGRRTDEKDGGKEVVLEIIDVLVAASEYAGLYDEYTKLTAFLEHFEGCEFEYELESKTLSFFRYLRNERVEEKDQKFYELKDEILDRFEKLVGSPDFIHEVIQRDGTNYSVDGVAIYRDYELKRIFGRIRKNKGRASDNDVSEKTSVDKLDSFTGLWNKVSALEYLREHIENGYKHQIIAAVIDLDYFKIINDTYGHAFGDEVIFRMAQILKSAVGGRGIASRFGGDEFMLVLEDIGTETELRSIIESIRTQLSWAFNDRVQGQRISCTIGIAEYPKNGEDFDTIFNKADRALYIGKQKGKNRYIIYKEHIHGELPTGEGKTLEQGIRDSLKVGEHLDGITWCFNTLCKSGSAGVKSVCERLMAMYIVDRITVYSGPDLKLIEQYGVKDEPLDNVNMIKTPEILTLFDDDGVCHTMFNHMISFFYEEFHGVLHKNGIFESTMFLIGNKRQIRGVIAFERLHIDRANSRKWSDEELHMLLVCTRIIGELLIN